MKYKNIDYEVIGYGTPVLIIHGWGISKLTMKGAFEPIPCLIIAAKQDTEVGYKDQFDLMKKYTNSTYVAVENAGHNLQIEQPEIFESIVISWLKTH